MDTNTLISAVVVLAILGLCFWLFESFIPVAEPFKTVIRVVIVIALILWLLTTFGIWSGFAMGVA